MKHIAQKNTKNGFTLVELMISLSIFLILFSMLVVIFKATQEGFIKASAMQDVFDTSRQIIGRMHEEASAAFFDPYGRASMRGTPSTGTRIKTDSTGDELFFCMPLSDQVDADIVEIGYWVRADGNLMRHFQAVADYDFATADADDELGLIVENLTFRYYNGTDYQTLWDSRIGEPEEGMAPKTIQMAFQVSDEDKFITRQFRSSVHLVTGKRY